MIIYEIIEERNATKKRCLEGDYVPP